MTAVLLTALVLTVGAFDSVYTSSGGIEKGDIGSGGIVSTERLKV